MTIETDPTIYVPGESLDAGLILQPDRISIDALELFLIDDGARRADLVTMANNLAHKHTRRVVSPRNLLTWGKFAEDTYDPLAPKLMAQSMSSEAGDQLIDIHVNTMRRSVQHLTRWGNIVITESIGRDIFETAVERRQNGDPMNLARLIWKLPGLNK